MTEAGGNERQRSLIFMTERLGREVGVGFKGGSEKVRGCGEKEKCRGVPNRQAKVQLAEVPAVPIWKEGDQKGFMLPTTVQGLWPTGGCQYFIKKG